MTNTTIEPSIQSSRLWFIDHVRVFLTVLVVAHHAGQPYGPTGGKWLIFNPERAEILSPFFAVNAAFFMGLFFLVSGYFLPGAYDRKGAKVFLRERLRRLGVPILFFAFLIFPLVSYFADSDKLSLIQFLFQVYLGQGQIQVGHLWFLMHLLFYALCYVLWRKVIQSDAKFNLNRQQIAVPSHRLIFTYLIGLAIATFLVRIQYPIDTWKGVFWIIPAELAHLPQYLSFFVVGILSYRHNWFRRMPTRRGFIWLGIGLVAALLHYGYSAGRKHWFPVQIIAKGGWNWRSLLWSTWEATICVGLCIGLLVFFREQCHRPGKWGKWLSANTYAVYLIHVLIIVPLQFLLAGFAVSPLLKFLVVTLIGVPLCFLLSDFLRRLPFTKAIL
ncbi:MAG: acyltransferase family protein [Stigonema ocellatum SAG 48.90 = DSM 106950]|nr:acyltransferase family protein [Stigonema ocellatum SAG 48.90 = DSM 106950]